MTVHVTSLHCCIPLYDKKNGYFRFKVYLQHFTQQSVNCSNSLTLNGRVRACVCMRMCALMSTFLLPLHLQTFHLVSLIECALLLLFFLPSFFADGCSLGSAVHSVTIALRHFALGVDPTAAYWDFDLLDGHGGWRAEGCHITGSGGNTTTIHCTHHNNFAVLMVSSLLCGTSVIHF